MASPEEEEEDVASSAGSEASEASSHASDDASDDDNEDEVPAAAAAAGVVTTTTTSTITLQQQVATLASCRPDVLDAKKRTALIQTVETVIRQDPAARTLLAEWKDLKCSSLHAHRRMIPLLTLAILQETTTGSNSTGNGNGTDTDNDRTLTGLLTLTTRLLKEASDPALVRWCATEWRRGRGPQHADSVDAVDSDDADAANAVADKLSSVLFQIVKRETAAATATTDAGTTSTSITGASSSSSSSSCTIPAVALGFALDRHKDDNGDTSRDWLGLLLQHTLSVFSTPTDLALASNILQQIPVAEWEATVAPVLQLKLKSHPDQALPTVQGWLEQIVNVGASSNSNSAADSAAAAAAATSPVATATDEWIQLLLKHVQSLKEGHRAKAAHVLVAWATGGGTGTNTNTNPNPNPNLAPIAVALATCKATVAPIRVTIYETLETLAVHATATAMATAASSNLDAAVLQTVLEGLCLMVSKEPKPEQRVTGYRAVLEWMVVAKKNSSNEKRSADAGYGQALELFRRPVQTKNSPDAAAVMGLLVQRVHPDLLESIVLDLYDYKEDASASANVKGNKLSAGIEVWVDGAGTKKSMQVEGLLGVYLALLYADETGQPVPAFCDKVLSVGSSTKPDPSFIYSTSMMNSVSTNPVVASVLPRTIALYTQLTCKRSKDSLSNLFSSSSKKITAAARAMAACISHPAATTITTVATAGGGGGGGGRRDHQYASNAILASLETILTYEPKAAEGVVQALVEQVNKSALRYEELVKEQNATREARESDSDWSTIIKGQGSEAAAHKRFDANAVRHAARYLVRHVRDLPTLGSVMVLMHAGSTLKSEGHQRAALILNTVNVIKDVLLPLNGTDESMSATLAKQIILYSTCTHRETADKTEGDAEAMSVSLEEAALSFITSLGGIACNFSPGVDDPDDEEMKPYVFASNLCLKEICLGLSTKMKSTLNQVEELSERDVRLYQSLPGTLFQESGEKVTSDTKKASGKRLTEEEQWEQEIQRELDAKKKKKEIAGSVTKELTPEEKKLVVNQDEQRLKISTLLEGDFVRVMDSIRYLCSSDIEVGNECLPSVAEVVLAAAVSNCPALTLLHVPKQKSFETLTSLATCVYEIDESHAPTLAQALVLSCRKDKSVSKEESKSGLNVSALPSPCAPAACVIYEVDQFDDKLSGSSFAFLFPVIQACLTGPRTPTGCEASLQLLERHTPLLAGEGFDHAVANLRKDMVASVLELLKHDRAQTFQDPTPFDSLIACYRTAPSESTKGPVLTTAELAPLLDERGALGNKSCRMGSMLALAHIAKDHQKFIKSNPLIENRIWLNCFESDESVRELARKAWDVVHGISADSEDGKGATLSPPSPLYAAILLPLLSHSDESIAGAAADAYAHGMAMHPKSVGRNIEALCKTYIESFPAEGNDASPSAIAKPKPAVAVAAPAKKKTISTGLPKRKAAPKSSLAVAGIGKPKVMKKRVVNSALLKPKEERTLDTDAFESQFRTSAAAAKDPEKDSPERVAVRFGVLRAVTAVTKTTVQVDMDESTLKLLTSFLMAYGIADTKDEVKGAARDALRDVVASKGGSDEAIAFLLPHLETILKSGVADESSLGSLSTEKVPRDVSASDRRKEGAVVALGSVALHLKGDENTARIGSTIDMLLAALKTPSEGVQSSVANALTKLMKKGDTQDRIGDILSELLKDCLYGDTMAVRRGMAYGLSAAVKGSGIATLKKYEIVKKLEEACASGGSSSKEGSLFAIELLSTRLGLLFEPYVIVLLPSLLKAFSDSSDYVRKAASDTVGLIMSKLSAHGVKLVLPAVLTAFDDPAWRTKQASIHMLGSMSHLAPKQLASALPKVVPKLTEAFSDTHPKVKASAEEALDEISTVIKNPEICTITKILLKALTDPADNTLTALEALIATEFLHAIDAPSLALIVPILHRGLRDRGASIKRYGALIAGNICAMINDPRDFLPYLPTLLPDLKAALLDPIPDVRSTSAKALGSLTRSLGDHILPELRPWLIQALRNTVCSSAERSGAAQGLTEVLIASGSESVDEVLRNEILPLSSYPEACTREGVLWVLTFLPPALGQGFAPFIEVTLPVLLSGLSDDSEPVRDVAMRAGRVLIKSHGKVHVDTILPSIEFALGEDDYRIRVAALSLLGDLLGTIGGTSVLKGGGDTQDDIRRAERAQAQIALALGPETRRRLLSDLYLARNDSVHAVRQSAIQVWKTVVSVTARTLRDILPVLVSKIIHDLASGHEDKTDIAGRCLGEVVGKLGESVLAQIIPLLRNSLYDGDEDTKRGVCVGLTDVLKSSTKDQILRYLEIIVKVIQDALCDDNETVRKMAAMTFKSLHAVVGNLALDQVVPSLMVALESAKQDDSARVRALHGLTGILSVRSRELLPYIIPRLIHKPMTVNHARALSGVAAVTGDTIFHHFSTIIPALLGALADIEGDDDTEREEVIRECCQSFCANVDSAGVNWLISEISSKCGNDKIPMRREACKMLGVAVTERADKQDFYEQIPIILRELLYRLNDEDVTVLKATSGALTALSKHVPAEELVKHVEFIRNLIASTVSDARRRKGGVGDGVFLMPGFNIPKGLEPLLPIYQRGILYGNPSIREVSASGLGELISITSTKFLTGPLIIKMTGPLLRVVGDRNPANVKIAILKTLGLILVKGGPALRAFVPQFQTTFVKALSDPSRQVRMEAIDALSLLMPLSTRVDPLIKELVSGSLGKTVSSEEVGASAVQTATLEALAAVLYHGGVKAKLPDSVPSALEASKELLSAVDDGIREAAAKVMGMACSLSGAAVTEQVLRDEILKTTDQDSSTVRHGKACAIRRILASDIGSEIPSILPDLKKLVLTYLKDDKSTVREAAFVAFGAVIGRSPDPKDAFKANESVLMSTLRDSKDSIDMERAVARGFCVALVMLDGAKRVDTMGLVLIDACLQATLKGSQRVQFAFNDVLWLVLDVEAGQDGLDRYASKAIFDSVRAMKSLHSKVLMRITTLSILKE